jgi:hypothetical protein
VRRVAGVQGDAEDVLVGRQEPVRGPLEEDPATQGARRLARDCRNDPVEVEP